MAPTFEHAAPGEPGSKAVRISVEIDPDRLAGYTDSYLATAWHVAQTNPAPYGDRQAGELVEKIGREIIRRWLASTEPELWHHQGRHHPFNQLRKLARYEPGGPKGTPQWRHGKWVPIGTTDEEGG